MSERIGFVGVGRMGANMARRLHDQNFTVTAVHDVHADGAKALAEELGATYYEKLTHVTKNSDVIITVVTDDKAMKSIFNGTGSLLARSTGKLFINCATISPATHMKVEEWAAKRGAQTLEASAVSATLQVSAEGQRSSRIHRCCRKNCRAYWDRHDDPPSLGRGGSYLGACKDLWGGNWSSGQQSNPRMLF